MVQPLWTVRTRFYWMQHFPAHKTTVLEHSYQPISGGFFFESTAPDPIAVKAFCMSPPVLAAARHLSELAVRRKSALGALLLARDTQYILASGNNWKGPIGHFHLTLDRLKTDNVLSLCWDGPLKQTGATTYEATRENFAPTRDIALLVLADAPPEKP